VHAPPEQLAFLSGLEGVRKGVEEAKKEADRTLGKAENLVLAFDSMSGKGPARRARRIAQEQRRKIEAPARLKAVEFLKGVEGLSLQGWYGRLTQIASRAKSEMTRPTCEIHFGRMVSSDAMADPPIRFRCTAVRPIEGFADLEEKDWVYFSGSAVEAKSDSLVLDLARPLITVQLTALEPAPSPEQIPEDGER
jgi:hypothetical protein